MNAATSSGICFPLRNTILLSYSHTSSVLFSRVRVVEENIAITVRNSFEYEKRRSVANTGTAFVLNI